MALESSDAPPVLRPAIPESVLRPADTAIHAAVRSIIAVITVCVGLDVRADETAEDPAARFSSAASAEIVSGRRLDEIRRLQRTEARLEQFAQDVLAHMDRHVASEEMREKIRHIFALFRANARGNPSRFTPPHEPFLFGPVFGFSYEFNSTIRDICTFTGPWRVITFGPDFDADSSAAMLSGLAHELVHVMHDDEVRTRVLPERYRTYWSSRGSAGDNGAVSVVPEREIEAFAVQLEILNVAARGRIKANVLAGKTPRILALDARYADILARCAKVYFGRSYNVFRQFIIDWYGREENTFLFTPDLAPLVQ